jgi:hypothetical protein
MQAAQALACHQHWEDALQCQLQSGEYLDVHTILDSGASELGAWLAGIAEVFGSMGEYIALTSALADFHLLASVIASLANGAPHGKAVTLFERSTVYRAASGSVRAALAQFQVASRAK